MPWKGQGSARHEVAMQGLLAAPLCSFLSSCALWGYVDGCFDARDGSQSVHMSLVEGHKEAHDHDIQLAVPMSQWVTQGCMACAIQLAVPISWWVVAICLLMKRSCSYSRTMGMCCSEDVSTNALYLDFLSDPFSPILSSSSRFLCLSQ